MHADNDNELPRTRAEAKAKGIKHYFTGKPCKNGHTCVRSTTSGHCVECDKTWSRKSGRKRRLEKGDEVRAYHRDYQKVRYHENLDESRRYYRDRASIIRSTPRGKIDNAITTGVAKGIRHGSKYGRQTFSLLGYTVEQLMAHLEKLFQPGMSWENYGQGGWHIDHRVPLSAHNYTSPDDIDFGRAWALENLQPLWERDNISKGAKIIAPFQPSLAFGSANATDKADDEAA